jgi:hypothetical protein
MNIDEIKNRLANKSTKELQRDFLLYRELDSKTVSDNLYQELVSQELDTRDKEYNDWIKIHNKDTL